MLSVKSVSKGFEGRSEEVVKNVSLELKTRSIFTIVGESGSGKTTLLKCIAGLYDLDEGEILINGEKVKGPKLKLVPGHPEIEMVFQDYDLMQFHTVYENVRYKLLQYPDDYQKERTDTVLRLCNISELRDAKPDNLSGGQKQRVSLARALANEPELILLDEPFSNLDNILKDNFRRLIKDIVSKVDTSFLMVSHDTPDALAMSERIAVMNHGEIIQIGTPEEVYNRPVNETVACFFGTPNIIIKDNQRFCLRAENIDITQDLKGAPIVEKAYFGSHYIYDIKSKEFGLLKVSSTRDFLVGDKVKYNFEKKHLHPFCK